MMSRHAARHARAYAAGARDACEAIHAALGRVLPDETQDAAALRQLIDRIRAERFPMPMPSGSVKKDGGVRK